MSPLKSLNFRRAAVSELDLRNLNILAAVLYLLQGLAILFLSSSVNGLREITLGYATQDALASQVAGHSVLATAMRHLLDLNLAYVVAAFLLISGVANLLSATRYRKIYERGLNLHTNKWRWSELALTGGVMMIALAMLVGISDLGSLVVIFGLSVLTAACGWMMALTNPKNRTNNWLSYWAGVFAGGLAWLLVGLYLKDSFVYGTGISSYVYYTYGLLLLMWIWQAMNTYKLYKKAGAWQSYNYGERMYLLTSFISKTALAWLIFAATLR